MRVSGSPVTPEQAKEIIRRTDRFFTHASGGNDHAWDERMASSFGMRHFYTYAKAQKKMTWEETHALRNVWDAKWGVIPTQYVHNNWLSSNFVGGPHGWCHPSGAISFSDNVGKWPSAEELQEDWQLLATAFPFLYLAVTFMSGESCEEDTTPVVTFLVRGGTVMVVPGDLANHSEFAPITPRTDADYLFGFYDKNLGEWSCAHEHGPIPEEWYQEWEGLYK